MTRITSVNETRTPVDVGCKILAEVPSSTINLASSIVASGNITSDLILVNGFKNWCFGIQLDQEATVQIQRYADVNATWLLGTTTALIPINELSTILEENMSCVQSMRITITNNSSTTTATISNKFLVIQA